MKKIMLVEGMSCGHCQASVEKALSQVANVESVKVDLKKKTAAITLSGPVADELLKAAVSEAGYEPVSIEDKKGLFG